MCKGFSAPDAGVGCHVTGAPSRVLCLRDRNPAPVLRPRRIRPLRRLGPHEPLPFGLRLLPVDPLKGSISWVPGARHEDNRRRAQRPPDKPPSKTRAAVAIVLTRGRTRTTEGRRVPAMTELRSPRRCRQCAMRHNAPPEEVRWSMSHARAAVCGDVPEVRSGAGRGKPVIASLQGRSGRSPWSGGMVQGQTFGKLESPA
jgi:hypothetical protein